MKKLAVVISSELNDEGTLTVKNSGALKLITAFLKEYYEITLLMRTCREKTISDLSDMEVNVIYDSSPQNHKVDTSQISSRFQINCLKWKSRNSKNRMKNMLDYDCLIAWDGCSPWCLATALKRVNAKKRIVWVHDNPEWYLMVADYTFYSNICSEFDVIIASDEKIKERLDIICKKRIDASKCVVVKPPIDADWYWKQSETFVDCKFQANQVNLVAVSRMCLESGFEKLPKWLSEHQNQCLSLHCYLIGDGERINRYIQQIAIYSVDSMITLVGQKDNPYPYIRDCDALLICEDEQQPDINTAAEVFGTPIICLEELEQYLPELRKKKRLIQYSSVIWEDEEKFMSILNEE